MQRYLGAVPRRGPAFAARERVLEDSCRLSCCWSACLHFSFYVFNRPPLLFSAIEQERLLAGPAAAAYASLRRSSIPRRESAARGCRFRRIASLGRFVACRGVASRVSRSQRGARINAYAKALALARDNDGGGTFTDVNYIIPTFILTQLDRLIGLLIVAIIMAATDTGELNRFPPQPY